MAGLRKHSCQWEIYKYAYVDQIFLCYGKQKHLLTAKH